MSIGCFILNICSKNLHISKLFSRFTLSNTQKHSYMKIVKIFFGKNGFSKVIYDLNGVAFEMFMDVEHTTTLKEFVMNNVNEIELDYDSETKMTIVTFKNH